jgi:hypothetical protein
MCDFLESLFNETSKPKKKEKVEKFFAACRFQSDKSLHY